MHHVFPPSEPPDGEHLQFFRLVVGGTQLRGSWYLSAIVRLQGFSSGSPTASPRQGSPKTVTSSSMVGRSEPGYDLGPALSFKDLHHPGWGGGRAEPELCLLRGSAGHLLPQTSTTRGWSTASVVSISTLGSLAQLALARLPVPPPAARAVVAPRAPEDRPRRRALLGRRSCSGAVLPLPRYGASVRRSVLRSSGRIRVGICRWADGFRRRR
jgi:hypothetical protein